MTTQPPGRIYRSGVTEDRPPSLQVGSDRIYNPALRPGLPPSAQVAVQSADVRHRADGLRCSAARLLL